MDLISTFSAEAFRYYFMSQCPFGGDGEFSFERFADVYNSGLADNLGNLYSRTLTMCVKYFDGRLEGASSIGANAWLGGIDLPALVGDLRGLIETFQYNIALQRIWNEVLAAANSYINTTAPFKLAKTDLDACRTVLINLAGAVRVIAILIKPFLPRTAETFYRAFTFEAQTPWEQVGYADVARRPDAATLNVSAALTGGKPVPLFPKIDTKTATT